MDQKYDQKFEEMKKYIPFLESMIKRLETKRSGSANPRQAQLDKIRSLRDLLLDQKKRMKMENLMKCEQVLVNLYSKVEQRETLPDVKLSTNPEQNSKLKNIDNDLEVVRNKLKTVTAIKVDEGQETLPEIARASIIEELCTPGSKEPALFQRRPNIASISPGRTPMSPNKSTNINASKRNYTRVLVSPEPNSKRWEIDEKTSDKPLFSRRSQPPPPPHWSPNKSSPTHTRKEKKKSSKKGPTNKANDLNITLNVPEESLDSLNSKDILSRIMNCSDKDVDIETLREAKRQILNELKHTGAKCDDISDLLLKSYKTPDTLKKKAEVEEGELSDSESEAIQSIYGNFILDDDENSSSKIQNSKTQEKARKIQICLVINSDKDGDKKKDKTEVPCNTDTTDFEMYNKNPSINSLPENILHLEKEFKSDDPVLGENNISLEKKSKQNQNQSVNTTPVEQKVDKHESNNKTEKVYDIIGTDTIQPANFYKPLKDEIITPTTLCENTLQAKESKDDQCPPKTENYLLKPSLLTDNLPEITAYLRDTETTEIPKGDNEEVEIPLLNEPSIATQKPKKDIVSEIDILQALKNEILSESLSIPGSETTPLLHQPKVTKVASAQEIAPKKRISIEKYKKKSAASAATVNSLFMNDPSSSDCSSSSWKEDNLRKQSLKLTEKECERFFSAKLDLDDDNDDDYDIGISDLEPDANTSLNDIYGNLVPKSPDHDEPSSTKNVPPVIIPVEPVKATLAPSKADVDMRKLAAVLSPNSMSPSKINTTKLDQNFMKSSVDKTRISLDPRVKRDVSQLGNIDTSVSMKLGSDRMTRPLLPTPMAPNMTPNRIIHMVPDITTCMSPGMAANMTPNMAANMTPNRNPNMTPRQSFGIDDNSARKHVYAPIFQSDNNEQPVAIERERKYYWEKSEKESETRNKDGSRWDLSESRDVNPNRDPRASSVHRETPDFSKSRFGEYYNHTDNFNLKYNERRDSYSRSECPRTPLPSFGRQDGSTTPSHTFGRLDAPMTPIHPFGRSECPPTPNQFSRADCPLTPSHPFGRPDCPQTLNHLLGRLECPSTPIHPFGRLDMPMTPSHPFGRSEPSRDPRLNRNSDYDHYLNDDTDRRISGSSESYREHRERKEIERSNYSDHGGRHYKEQPFRRDSSVGRALARDFKNDRLISRDRGYGRAVDEHHRKNDSNVDSRRGFNREQSIGRSVPTDGRRHNSSSRAPSINRTRDSTDYSFSVKPEAGTSFTINTSVRSTFQDFINNGKNTQIFDNKFDNRRKRAASVGRTLCRESSVSRSFHDTPKKTIVAMDNIVNRNNTFRRARSVGRDVMTSETERSFKDIKADFEKYRLDHGIHKSKGFHKSIDNRDLKRIDKSYDFKESRRNDNPFDIKEPKRNDKPYDIKEPRRNDKIYNKSSNPQSKRDVSKSESVGFVNKKPYSPRKNRRDPRLRRELQYSKNKYNNDNQREKKEMRNIGIVYSNDNISKGTILGSGYGVKNYKIPKIKRLVEEKEEKIEEKKEDKIEEKKVVENKVEKTAEKKEKMEEKAAKRKEEKICYNKDTPKPQREKKAIQSIKTKVLNTPDKKIEVDNSSENICQTNTEQIEKCEKRVTRSSLKNDSLLQSDDEDSIVKPKKTKKPFVYDSDSEYEFDKSEELDYSDKQETDLKKTSKNNIETKDTLINEHSNKEQNILLKDIVCTQNLNKEITPKSNKVNQLEPSFSIDDLELFSDNIALDPVIDNINALIADLDNDIEPSPIKTSSGFSNNVTVENMLEDINSGEDDNFEAATADSHELAEVNKHAFDQSPKFNELLSSIDNNSKCSVTSNNQKETQIVKSGSKKQINNIKNSKDLDSDFTKRDSESIKPVVDCVTKSSITFDNIVSTTEENHSENIEKEKGISPESNSVPDSTNEITSKTTVMEESLPDSTNETRTDTNSIVTSSHDSLEIENKDNTESCLANNDATSINSIGNILSILQDKSKLKEILSLLSDKSGENEKIKKKLEKLSEIVLDDDDKKEKEPSVMSQNINSKLAHDSVAIEFDKDKSNTENQEKSEINASVTKEKETRVFGVGTPNISDTLLNKSNDTDSTIDPIDKTNPAFDSDITLENINTKPAHDAIAIEFDKDEANTETTEESELTETVIKKNTVGKEMPSKNKKGKIVKNSKAKKKNTSKGVKRITRSAILQNKVKKPSRELLKLQKDIKEMFISDDVLNATGIRMCRLAKLVDDKSSKLKEYTGFHDSSGPMVVLDKFKETETAVDTVEKKIRKKPGPKPKTKPVEPIDVGSKTGKVKPLKCKPGPKSKTKLVHKSDDEDPYAFESDSVSENNFSTRSVDNKDSSDSENESIGSSQSFGSTDLLIELKKKPKRKRSSWKAGIIKPKNRKKKPVPKLLETPLSEDTIVTKTPINVSVLNTFTDKLYCFYKNIDTYSCRLCAYSGNDIVNHYKQEHPHSEIPLSRLSPDMAKEAIEQCEEINFQTISKIPSDKYVCRFCFKEFAKKKAVLETFFWHVVSMHTGEYKQLCTLCPMSSKCPFNLDIPPPPKDVKGQLIGYICEKCNFTQISLENLKTHVIVRHNDEQTEVYTINLSATSRLAMINALSSHDTDTEKPRVLRSTRSNQSAVKGSDDHSDMTDSDPSNEPLSPAKRCIRPKKSISPAIAKPSKPNIQSKITFENEDNLASTTVESCNSVVKVKIEKEEESPEKKRIEELKNNLMSEICNAESLSEATEHNVPVDIFVDPHFKVTYSNSGSKEYVCCINGQEHYNTSLLISFKKHVQLKHSEIWDGYCSLCKVIVTPQGHHNFKDCLQHYLDKHMDNFPVLKAKETGEQKETKSLESKPPSNKNYINVRPISELLFNDINPKPAVELPTLPKIENVMSLGAEPAEPPQASPSYQPVPVLPESPVEEKQYKYEEVQAEVMSKKQRVVLDTMMCKAKLVNVFKCAGRYCSFSSDSAEEALLHASTHQRVGGENSLSCAYCDFDCAGNAIDLVMHVFKVHGSCPYVCGHCFYRAAASQLVSAHSTRIHNTLPQKILSAINVAPPQSRDSSMLPREVVVHYYVCPHACKFRTYTAGKFCEHLEQRHSSVSWHDCYMCSESVPTAAQLVHHMKAHELNLYQCTWCVHGADTEPGLMFHASQKHPGKQPQAYLRVITNKDGSSEFRVLPLASFNKSKVVVEEVKAVINKENPVREAERSIDLEKLIGHTNKIIESMVESPTTVAPLTETESAVTSITMNESDILADNEPQNAVTILQSSIPPERPVTPPERPLTPPERPVTPPERSVTPPERSVTPTERSVTLTERSVTPTERSVIPPERSITPPEPPVTPPLQLAINEQVTPKIKAEPTEIPTLNVSDVIICLDSDEEEQARQPPAAAVPDDPSASQPATKETSAEALKLGMLKVICPTKLYTCPNCTAILKTPTSFKSHVNSCCSNLMSFRCPHCGTGLGGKLALHAHLAAEHSGEACETICGICQVRFKTLSHAKRHMKTKHKVSEYALKPSKDKDDVSVFILSADDSVLEMNVCALCDARFATMGLAKGHMKNVHGVNKCVVSSRKNHESKLECVLSGVATKSPAKRKLSAAAAVEPPAKLTRFGPADIDRLPINPILDELVDCALCEFKTKVRLNMVRHLQAHAEQQPAPHTAPINPVPHLETNEKHFDKMLNLASSSNAGRPALAPPPPAPLVPPEAASRYPRFVEARARHTCGARGCSYISVDEAMLRCHWSTLHEGSNDFHCVHCPPYQHLDTSKPLTPARIIAHLKMHDATLYACSACPYYHYKRQVLDKHLLENHNREGRFLIVREAASTSAGASVPPAAAPTMDLKPWQCGLCSFKSMLRPEVAEHCAKLHQSKMQFRCYYCPFRTSGLENVAKHQANSHPGLKPEVCYYYYREGSIPDEVDGSPRWMKQRQKFGTPENLEVKSEDGVSPTPVSLKQLIMAPQRPIPSPPVAVDLNIVKKEVDDPYAELTIDQLKRKYGEFCKPNGLKYQCPHCQVTEESMEAMQSHLYEELSYRKWGCSKCEYKGFHRARLNEHYASEHRGQNLEPIQRPTDVNIEKWVFHFLETQTKAIAKAKESLPMQRVKEKEPNLASTSKLLEIQHVVKTSAPQEKANKFGYKQLEEAFGPLGEPANSFYCCPKCNFKVKEEAAMRDHLEIELTKIRWCCSNCVNNFQTYHEAQFHCKSEHPGQASRPVEALRDPALRAAWASAALLKQAQAIRTHHKEPAQLETTQPPETDNSLLVVRFEKAANLNSPSEPLSQQVRKRPSPDTDDSDDDSDYGDAPTTKPTSKCPHCSFHTRYSHCLRTHVYRHFNLKPLSCTLCDFSGYRSAMMYHLANNHHFVADIKYMKHTKLPDGPPILHDVKIVKTRKNWVDSSWQPFKESREKEYATKNDNINTKREKVQCNTCKSIIEVGSLHEHHEDEHSTAPMSYSFLKLVRNRNLVCGYCNGNFKLLPDLTLHHSAVHNTLKLKYTTVFQSDFTSQDSDDDCEVTSYTKPVARPKMVARKSTSKLPAQTVARKSTTKLPYHDRDDEEYSYYGTRPTPLDEYEHVTTLMSFNNTMMPFTVQKLCELIKLSPVVRVIDMKAGS